MIFDFKLLLFTLLSSFLVFGGEGKELNLEKRSTKIWLEDVYDGTTCGKPGKAMTGFAINYGTEGDINRYRVHIKGGGWLPVALFLDLDDFKYGYGGTKRGDPIDGIAIYGVKPALVKYRVHLKGYGWLPWVNGYDINEPKNGYAGILGYTIDLIQVKGRRLYTCAYNE